MQGKLDEEWAEDQRDIVAHALPTQERRSHGMTLSAS